jgi:hypothetical protein
MRLTDEPILKLDPVTKDNVVGLIICGLIIFAMCLALIWLNVRDRSQDAAHIERAKETQSK